MKTLRNNLRCPVILLGKLHMLKHIQLVVLAGILVMAGSCNKDDENTVTFKATINGASEVPAVASEATGTATLTFNTDTKMFDIVVTYSGVTAIASHIHEGDVGVSGGVVFGFTTITSPINYTSAALDADQEAALFENMYYVNIHSDAYKAGEIRGQLIKQ